MDAPKRIQRKRTKGITPTYTEQVNVALPVIPKVCCPVCLRQLVQDKVDGQATVTFLHWPSGCKLDNTRYDVIIGTHIGFAPRHVNEAGLLWCSCSSMAFRGQTGKIADVILEFLEIHSTHPYGPRERRWIAKLLLDTFKERP